MKAQCSIAVTCLLLFSSCPSAPISSADRCESLRDRLSQTQDRLAELVRQTANRSEAVSIADQFIGTVMGPQIMALGSQKAMTVPLQFIPGRMPVNSADRVIPITLSVTEPPAGFSVEFKDHGKSFETNLSLDNPATWILHLERKDPYATMQGSSVSISGSLRGPNGLIPIFSFPAEVTATPSVPSGTFGEAAKETWLPILLGITTAITSLLSVYLQRRGQNLQLEIERLKLATGQGR